MTHTIFDALSSFQEANTSANMKAIRSVIHRFLVEHWGGEAPKGSKATSDETSTLANLLKTLPATMLVGTIPLLEQEFLKKEIPKENSKSYRYAYKKFFDWAENNGYFKKTQEKDNELTTQYPSFRNSSNTKNQPKFIKHHRECKDAYALMSIHANNRKDRGQLVYANDYINSSLAQQLKLFKLFRQEKADAAKATVSYDMKEIDRILGWLHRYKNIPLENLRLTSIIHFTKLNLAVKDFKDKQGKINHKKFILQKSIARQEGIDLANENIILIEEYLNFVGGHPGSRLRVLTLVIAVAKFVYKNEIGKDEYTDASELPIVKRLRQLNTDLTKLAKNAPPTVPHEDKSVSWSEAINLLGLSRKRADCLFTISSPKCMNMKIKKQKRTRQAVINNLQLFLSLAFMLLIPTDRSRTYYELEIGRTFKFGLHQNGKFTPVNKLADQTQAVWYIHLLPADYKTGKHYEPYWGVMPNVSFEDGKKLYDYIDTWINEGREYRQKCNHNYFFRGIIDYEPLDSTDWGKRIRTMFETETNVPVTPKEIRKMYITWINNLGASHAQLKAAATAMHHSQKMQESVYNSQTVFERVAPIMELNAQMWKDSFGTEHFGSNELDPPSPTPKKPKPLADLAKIMSTLTSEKQQEFMSSLTPEQKRQLGI